MWQPSQVRGAVAKLLPVWHWVQARVACAPVSGKPEMALWSKVALVQVVVLWHCEQSVEKPPAR